MNNIEKKSEEFVRFSLNFRIQHLILLISVIFLIISGIPLKFPHQDWAKFVIGLLGGPESARGIHHFGALGLIIIGIFHVLYTIFTKEGRKDFFELIPKLKDAKDIKTQILYFLGKSKTKARFGRFSYVQKFDYWAVYWGCLIMIGTGVVMWLFQGKFEPLFFGLIELPFGPNIIDNYVHAIAREAHSDEALLATLAIVIWHFYNEHLNPHKFPMNKVWITGKVTKEEMLDEHPIEFEEILKQREMKENEKISGKNL